MKKTIAKQKTQKVQGAKTVFKKYLDSVKDEILSGKVIAINKKSIKFADKEKLNKFFKVKMSIYGTYHSGASTAFSEWYMYKNSIEGKSIFWVGRNDRELTIKIQDNGKFKRPVLK